MTSTYLYLKSTETVKRYRRKSRVSRDALKAKLN